MFSVSEYLEKSDQSAQIERLLKKVYLEEGYSSK